MAIPNKYKDILEGLIDSLDIKYLAILRQIDLSNDDIPNFKDKLSDFKIDKDLLDRSQGQQECWITSFPS